MATTLRHVADHLQLSQALVSRVLNHVPGKWASQETQKRIFEAASELNYRPSAAAMSLRTGKTRQLAAVSVEGDSRIDQFLDLEGLVSGAGEEQHRIVVLPLRAGPDGEKSLDEFLANRACDGLCLFAPQVTENHLRAVGRHDIPCVVIGSLDDEALAQLALEYAAIVDHDNYRAAFDSVSWLHAQGKKRIAWAKIPNETDQAHVCALRNGYLDAMSQHDLQPLLLEYSDSTQRAAFLAERKVDAVIVRYIHGAMGWMLAAREAGLQLPDELTIMAHLEAHDAGNLVLCGAEQSLALHLYGVREVGYRAAQILLRWAGGEPPTERTILVAPHAPAWGRNYEELRQQAAQKI